MSEMVNRFLRGKALDEVIKNLKLLIQDSF
jgi:hypothetical protein